MTPQHVTQHLDDETLTAQLAAECKMLCDKYGLRGAILLAPKHNDDTYIAWHGPESPEQVYAIFEACLESPHDITMIEMQ